MKRKKTFVDAGVLIAAARGKEEISAKAREILDDPNREFVSSPFLKLEILPKPIYEKRKAEVEFYEIFFNAVIHWADSVQDITKIAYAEACRFGLSAMDALHVAAAIAAGAQELVTTEKPEKPIHRVDSINILSIRSFQSY
ncbi:MAG: PIN domain-containing protein [Thermodesulfobacteriota bacterium]